MKKKSDTIFVVLVYKYDDKARKFVGTDNPSGIGLPYYCVLTDPGAVLDKARHMIYLKLIQEYVEMGHALEPVVGAMKEAVKSADARLIRLPRVDDVDSNVGFLMGRFDVSEGDLDNFAYVRALVVKANDDHMIKRQDNGQYEYSPSRARGLRESLLPAVNSPEEI